MNVQDGRVKLVKLDGKRPGYIEDTSFIQTKEIAVSNLPDLKKLDLASKVDQAIDVKGIS